MKFFARKGGDKPEIRGAGVATSFTTLQFSSIAFTFSDVQSFEFAMYMDNFL